MFFRKSFLSTEQKKRIVEAIANAERETSGEIRVHIEPKCKKELLERSAEMFKELNMHETAQRNGVLIYVAYQDRKFAILGDKGINEVVPENFWDEIKVKMRFHFSATRFTEGIIEAIELTGEHLRRYFPYQSDDVNELSNEISEG